ncbi:Transmembrane protein 126A [Tinamus guttatus]|uniref:Transmembrane protein 126A n=1 Tax=Tinamus guttatus TaxID=94827 RepID=A0A099Z224_TINGU|nr:Transmembrane protein 126A [Tinamus guttatus]
MAGREFLEPGSPQSLLHLRKLKHEEIMTKLFEGLPKEDQNLVNHGSYVLAANSSLCGLTANNFFRRTLNITRAAFVSSLPMAVLPFMSTAVVYDVFVRQPLFLGDLNCEACAVVRGGLIGAIVGGFYPFLMALPVNASLAARYVLLTCKDPKCTEAVNFWIYSGHSEGRKMTFGILIQTLTGIYLAAKHNGVYFKMLEQLKPRRDPEELEA